MYKTIKRLIALCLVALIGLVALENIRSGVSNGENSLARAIIFKDYFAPGHMLIASMYYDLIDPIHVLLSNFYNSMVMFNYPYLQTPVGNKLIEGSSSRSTGFAMYIFSEGYMFCGWCGTVYNGIVATLGIIFWRMFSRSNNYAFNAFAMGLVGTQLANIVRGQSSYFIKDFYMLFIIAFVLYFLMTGFKPIFSRKAET